LVTKEEIVSDYSDLMGGYAYIPLEDGKFKQQYNSFALVMLNNYLDSIEEAQKAFEFHQLKTILIGGILLCIVLCILERR